MGVIEDFFRSVEHHWRGLDAHVPRQLDTLLDERKDMDGHLELFDARQAVVLLPDELLNTL